MKYTYQETLSMIESIASQNYNPTEWEEQFLAGITDHQESLTQKQSDCLTAIYAKATGGGRFQMREYFRG